MSALPNYPKYPDLEYGRPQVLPELLNTAYQEGSSTHIYNGLPTKLPKYIPPSYSPENQILPHLRPLSCWSRYLMQYPRSWLRVEALSVIREPLSLPSNPKRCGHGSILADEGCEGQLRLLLIRSLHTPKFGLSLSFHHHQFITLSFFPPLPLNK